MKNILLISIFSLLSLLAKGQAPANDFCTNAITVTPGETVTGETTSATVDNAVAPDCGSATTTGSGIWYKFTGTGETISLSTCNDADFDTSLSVFIGSCNTGLSCLAGNDDGNNCFGFTSQVEFNSILNEEYYILVHTFETETGIFDLTVSSTPTNPQPANDNCLLWHREPGLRLRLYDSGYLPGQPSPGQKCRRPNSLLW